MTALKEYQRLEATGLWRPSPEQQRREVYVSIGDATLTINSFNNQALTHWSLAAIQRRNPDEFPAIYHPDGDSDETLELAESEGHMIEAIERLRRAVERARPHPGRLRSFGVAGVLSAALVLAVFWLPGAMRRHTLDVVPVIKRQEIGDALLARVERLSGRACRSPETQPVLSRLARRLAVRRIVILPGGLRDSLHLPGSIVLLNRALVEDHEDPAVLAGYVLTEKLAAARTDPLGEVLQDGGVFASFRLLTTGEIPKDMLDTYAERIVTAPKPVLSTDAVLKEFADAKVPSTPYARARDITGESTLPLIEADPMKAEDPAPVMRDRDWVLLQGICGG